MTDTTGPTGTARASDRSAGERGALRSFRRAARLSPGYRTHLARTGVEPRAVRALGEVPYSDKATVFGGALEPWLVGGRLTDAAEIITSSGAGGAFSLGVGSRAERRRQERAVDAALRGLGAGGPDGTLLMNCLPMGVSVPSALATVATPSVHLGAAVALLARVGDRFGHVVVVAEPLFLKELAESCVALLGTEVAARVHTCVVGGEWVAESLRRHIDSLLGFAEGEPARPGILISMGAAEVGIHALHETPALRAARAALDSPEGRTALTGRDEGFTPTLLTWDPERLHLEERAHDDGTRTLVVTALDRRMLPLVRYDLDDECRLWDAERVDEALARCASDHRVTGPVAAVWGRRTTRLTGPGWTLRPEAVKEALFATADDARDVTGRFRLSADGGVPGVHLQLRAGATTPAGDASPMAERIAARLGALTGAPARVHAHADRDYPFHESGDFQHKPRYI